MSVRLQHDAICETRYRQRRSVVEYSHPTILELAIPDNFCLCRPVGSPWGLGVLASQQGSKWWLTVPGIIIGGLAFGLYLGFHSF